MAILQVRESHRLNTDIVPWFRRRQRAIFWLASISGCFAFWGFVAWLILREI
jgi:hypothetical protein